MKKILFLIIIFLIINIAAFSEEISNNDSKIVELSFEQAYELMLENNNSLKAYNESIAKGKYEKRSALGQFAPKVVLNSTYLHFSKEMNLNTQIKVLGFTLPPITSNIQEKNLFVMGGGAVWNIFTGGKLLSNHAAARAMLEATNAKYREVQDNLTLDLVKRYYGLRMAKDVVSVRKQVLDCVAQHVKDAKLLEKEGVISKSERLHAEVVLADTERDYKASLRDMKVVEEGLKTLIKADGVNLNNVSIEPKSDLFIYDESNIDVDAMKENALKNNPQLKQLAEKRKIMNAKYHAQIADYMPTVSVFATDIFAASHLSEAVPRGAIGAGASMLLFDGFSRTNNVLAVKHERQMVDYEIKDARYNIECLVLKQYEELMKYKERFDYSVKSVEKAEEALKVANYAFKEGVGTSLQVTDAQMNLLKVKIDRLNSIYNYDVTLTDLLKTNGDTKEILNYATTSPQTQM